MIRYFSLLVSIGAAILFQSCKPSPKETKPSHVKNTVSVSDKYPHELLDSLGEASIIFYNVENLFDTIDDPAKKDEDFLPNSKKKWNSQRYLDKLDKLTEVLTFDQKENPVFIGLAEIENRFVVRDLVQRGRLAETKYRLAHFDSPDVRGIDVALAFDHNRFHMTHKEAIPVKLVNDQSFKTRDILYVKGVFHDSTEVHVFVNHWSSRRGGEEATEHKRIRAAKVLKSYVDSLQALDDNANVIIMGDFNDYPTNKSIEEVLNANDLKSSSTLVNLLAPYHDRDEGTHNYRGEWGTLDQIIVSRSLLDGKNLEIKGKKASIIYNNKFLYTKKDGSKTPNRTYGGNSYFGGYSDHLAVMTYMQLK